ncbi:MAG: hypothetical protein A3H32_13430 [Betaproteobacteria bacterium RIFCSPLOWO2_02_FULL_63_19]|nr:MAG: hypothetical protein A3H32_13430 [Betaproteobacteria bacterium RIFCSPLOWO2_02_FULL_63_19]
MIAADSLATAHSLRTMPNFLTSREGDAWSVPVERWCERCKLLFDFGIRAPARPARSRMETFFAASWRIRRIGIRFAS